MPVRIEFLNGHPAPIMYANPETAFCDLRTRMLKAETLAVEEPSIEAGKVSALLDEVKPSVKHLSVRIVPPYGQPCPLYDIKPSNFQKLESLTVGGFFSPGLSVGFDRLQRLELRASPSPVACTDAKLHVLLTAMNTWSSLTVLSLHHYTGVFTAEPLPSGFVIPVALPPTLKTLVVEDVPSAVCFLLLYFILPPSVHLHLIASCTSFPIDAGPLFQMLTPSPFLEFSAAPCKVELPILGQVSDVVVEFTDNLKITGATDQGNTIVLEISAPAPTPDGMASRPALLSAALRRLPELFNNALRPDQQAVRKLTVNADVSHVSPEDWFRPLGRYSSLWELHVLDRTMGSTRAVLEALCMGGDFPLVCPHLYTLELTGPRDGDANDLDALLYTLQTRCDHGCDLVNLTLRYLAAEGSLATSTIGNDVKSVSPNTIVQSEVSQEGLRGIGGGY